MDLLRRFRMPVNLSIKNVPDHLAEEVRKRAAKHHRSLQGELISILEETVAQEKGMTPAGFLKELRALRLKTPSESLKIIRRDRDARSSR
jgi:plasmid stability protein